MICRIYYCYCHVVTFLKAPQRSRTFIRDLRDPGATITPVRQSIPMRLLDFLFLYQEGIIPNFDKIPSSQYIYRHVQLHEILNNQD